MLNLKTMNTDKTNEPADATPRSQEPIDEIIRELNLKKVEPSVEVKNIELETKELVVPRFFGVRGGVR